MLWAPMPEAAVHEYGNFVLWEDDVSTASDTFKRACVHSVSQSLCVEQGTQSEFWFGISAAIREHNRTGFTRGGFRPGW